MSAIFFKITPKQETEVKQLMEEEGYTSKSEFFRFLIKFFKYHKSTPDLKLKQNTEELAKVLKQLNKQGKLNISIDDQLNDV